MRTVSSDGCQESTSKVNGLQIYAVLLSLVIKSVSQNQFDADYLKVGLMTYSGLLSLIISKHGGAHEWNVTSPEAAEILYVRISTSTSVNGSFTNRSTVS